MRDLAGAGAVISDCGTWRYRLDRHVGGRGPVYAFFGVNPSTATAEVDDATVRKWNGFARRLDADRYIVGNAFAYRATDVRQLKEVPDPVGPSGNRYLQEIIGEADVLVPCWGNVMKVPTAIRSRFGEVIEMLRSSGKPVKCFGLTNAGYPKHPLMLGYSTRLVNF